MRDPSRETERINRQFKGTNYLIIIGAGGLYHIPPQDPGRRILLIIPDSFIFNAPDCREKREEIAGRKDVLICRADYRDGRPAKDFLEQIDLMLKNSYRPLFHPRLDLFSLPPLERAMEELFNGIRLRIRHSLDEIHSDYLTQKRFGKMWFLNMLRNTAFYSMRELNETSHRNSTGLATPLDKLRTMVAGKQVAVLGAGPGLDHFLDRVNLAQQRQGKEPPTVVIAVDSALPPLIARGVVPDAVVSTDPQYFSLLHHIPGQEGILLCDPGVHPAILRLYTGSFSFISTAHPMVHSGLFSDISILPLPFHFTQVGGSAGAAALAMGASRIRFYGLDFRYPGGAAYARGSYQHIWTGQHANRLNPVEDHFFQLVSGNGENVFQREESGHAYSSPRFEAYRREFEQGMNIQGTLQRSAKSYTLNPFPSASQSVTTHSGTSDSVTSHSTTTYSKKYQSGASFRDYASALNQITEEDCRRFLNGQYSEGDAGRLQHIFIPVLPLMYHMLGNNEKIDSHSVFRVIQFATRRISHIMML